MNRQGGRISDRGRVLLIGLAVAFVVVLVFGRAIAGFYIDYLWHQNLGRTDVFWGALKAKVFLFGGFALVFIVLAVLNLLIADRLAPTGFGRDTHPAVLRFHEVFGHRMRLVRLAAGALLGLIVAVPAAGHWQQWLLYRNSVNFGKNDPQFNTDIGFYMFQLPFLSFIMQWLFVAVLLVTMLTLVAHLLNGGIAIVPPIPKIRRATKAHLAVLLAVLALLRAASYWLERYELTTERRGFVQGATYAVVNAQLPAVLLLMLIAVLVAALFLYSLRTGSWRIPLVACALWVVVALVGGVIYPAVIQALSVNPNQAVKEAPYIKRNVEATRDALGIGDVVPVPVTFGNLDAKAVTSDIAPLQDVRLLNPEVMKERFNFDQGQQAGLAIKDLDVDRYELDGKVQQTLVAARELDSSKIPNKTWQGQHLIFTHGCGLVSAPASEVQTNNRPIYSDLKLDYPELYFGSSVGEFAIVDSQSTENDCPGAEPRTYQGLGGVKLDSSVRQFAFALSFLDYNMLGSQSITDNSRVMWVRDVDARVKKLAPFLSFDADPYPVALNGRVLWVVDGYTTSDQYPYAQDADVSQVAGGSGLAHSFNYARNSVKAVVDGYDGTVTFYVVDTQDPILKVWRKAFPNLFTDASKMPAGLDAHLRYPEDLFRIQTSAYSKYRLAPEQFFGRKGAWSVAQAPPTLPNNKSTTTATADGSTTAADTGLTQDSTATKFTPYYTMFHPPGSTDAPTFSLLRPFVPYSQNDERTELQSFMVASSDPASYGQLTVYEVQNKTDGPVIVANNAESDGLISKKITELNQQGSQVEFGDLQIVPLADGLLYVRPFYVLVDNQAEYRYVIVSYNSTAAIDTSLAGAIKQLFPGFKTDIGDRSGAVVLDPATDPVTTPSTEGDTPAELLTQAQALFDEADQALSEGAAGFAGYAAKQAEARALVEQALKLLAAG